MLTSAPTASNMSSALLLRRRVVVQRPLLLSRQSTGSTARAALPVREPLFIASRDVSANVVASASPMPAGIDTTASDNTILRAALSFLQDQGLEGMDRHQEGLQGILKDAQTLVRDAQQIEMVDVLDFLHALGEAIYVVISSPFVVFSPDTPILNVLFLAACALLAYNIVIQAPRQ